MYVSIYIYIDTYIYIHIYIYIYIHIYKCVTLDPEAHRSEVNSFSLSCAVEWPYPAPSTSLRDSGLLTTEEQKQPSPPGCEPIAMLRCLGLVLFQGSGFSICRACWREVCLLLSCEELGFSLSSSFQPCPAFGVSDLAWNKKGDCRAVLHLHRSKAKQIADCPQTDAEEPSKAWTREKQTGASESESASPYCPNPELAEPKIPKFTQSSNPQRPSA